MPIFADVTSAVAEDWTPTSPSSAATSTSPTSSSSVFGGILKRINSSYNTPELFVNHEAVVKRTNEFINTPIVTMEANNSICVLQKEACLYPITTTSSTSLLSSTSSSINNIISNDNTSLSSNTETSNILLPSYIGSTDATTCSIVFLYGRPAPGTAPILYQQNTVVAATLVAHVDSANTVENFISKITDLLKYIPGSGGSILNPLELSIIGSYDKIQHSRTSEIIVTTLLRLLDKLRLHIRLNIATVWDINTKYMDENNNILNTIPVSPTSPKSITNIKKSGSSTSLASKYRTLPKFTAAAINIHTGDIIPCRFTETSIGPYHILRNAYCWMDNHNLSYIYSLDTQYYVKPILEKSKFSLDSFTIIYLLSLNDNDFLRKASTSPDAEGPDFVKITKATLRYILDFLNSADENHMVQE